MSEDRGTADFRTKSAVALLIRVVSAGLSFVSQILLARWLGIDDYGVLTAVLVWVNVVGTVSTLGFATSVLRFLPAYLACHSFPLARGFHRTGMVVALLAGSLLASMGLLLAIAGFIILPQAYEGSARIALLALPAFALADFLDGVGRSRGWVGLALVPPYIIRPILILLAVAALRPIGLDLDASWGMFAATLAIWASALAQWMLQRRALGAVLPAGPAAYDVALWIRLSLPMLLLDAVALLLLNIDVILLGFFVGPGDIARYFAAQRIISLISFIHFAVGAAAVSHFATSHAAGRHHLLRSDFSRSRALAFYPSILLAAVLIGLGQPLLALFGPAFPSAWPVMIVLCAGLLARAAAGPAQALLVSTGHHNMTVLVLCATLIANCAFGVILIPRFGLLGAASASMIATVCESLMFAVLQHRLFPGSASLDEARHGIDQPAS